MERTNTRIEEEMWEIDMKGDISLIERVAIHNHCEDDDYIYTELHKQEKGKKKKYFVISLFGGIFHIQIFDTKEKAKQEYEIRKNAMLSCHRKMSL